MTNMGITWVYPSITIDHLFGWEKTGALRSLSRRICKTRWISSCRWVWTSHRKCCVTNCSRLFSGLSTLCLLSLILILPSRIHPIKPPTVFLGIAGLAPAEKNCRGRFRECGMPHFFWYSKIWPVGFEKNVYVLFKKIKNRENLILEVKKNKRPFSISCSFRNSTLAASHTCTASGLGEADLRIGRGCDVQHGFPRFKNKPRPIIDCVELVGGFNPCT